MFIKTKYRNIISNTKYTNPKRNLIFLLIIYLYNRHYLKYTPLNIYEKNISAKQFSKKKKARFPLSNGYQNWEATYSKAESKRKKNSFNLKYFNG